MSEKERRIYIDKNFLFSRTMTLCLLVRFHTLLHSLLKYNLDQFVKVPETHLALQTQHKYENMRVTIDIIYHEKFEVHFIELSIL